MDRCVFGGFVLAGGRSTRMGFDKTRAMVGGHALIERMLDKFRSLGLSPIIAGGDRQQAGGPPVVPDLHPGCGPLSGMEAALSSSAYELNLFLGVDLPLMSVEILRLLLERASLTQAWATVPMLGGRPQPLCAVYSRALVEPIQAALDHGEHKIMRVLGLACQRGRTLDLFHLEDMVAARVASPAISWRYSFLNCNTPADLREVEWKAARQELIASAT